MSAEVAVTIDDKDFQAMMKRLKEWQATEGNKVLSMMALYYQRKIDFTFQMQGARDGLPKWAPRSRNTILTPAGTRRLSYGTDMVPMLTRQQFSDARGEAMRIGWWKWGQKGYFRGYSGLRRYSATGKVLQVSGGLKAMFSQIRRYKDRVVVGAPTLIKAGRKYVSTAELISKTDHRPARPVITVTERDRESLVNVVKLSIYNAVHKK